MIRWVNTSECACSSAAMERHHSPGKAAQALNCVTVLLTILPTSFGSYPTYEICPPVQLSCGEKSNQSVAAPFRTDDQPESCGRRSFRLFCHGEYPAIQINSAIYWVKDMDYQTLLLTLVNVDFLGSVCPPTSTSTNLDVSPFAFGVFVQKVSIYYDCSCRAVERGFFALTCPANASSSSAYLTTESLVPHPYWGCSCHGAVIHAAIHRSEFEDVTKRDSIDPASLNAALRLGFQVVWPAAYKDSNWCGACKTSGGNCTYDHRWPAGQSCSCQGGFYSPVCPSQGEARGGTLSKKAIIGIALGSGLLVALCLLFHLFFCFYHCKIFCRSQDIEAIRRLKRTKYIEAFLKRCRHLAPRRYSYSELKKMTSSFSDMIGRGGFAEVFKGKLHDGCSVAVKVLSERNSRSNGRDFVNEVASIGCTYHVNIVSLLGYCLEDDKRALIYEFMPNGSLDRFIFGDKRGTLGWRKLHEIAVGIARGLEYLHRGCEMSIFHLDIKPHNILLDQEFQPKISDFGLAKLCTAEKSDVLISCGRGTIGYMSPEARNPIIYGRISSKSDVYSFGKMVLGMVGGKSNIDPLLDHTSEVDYPHWICRHLDQDGKFEMHGTSTEEEQLICRRMIMVGFWCIQINPGERPSIDTVVAMLEGRIEDLHLPPYCILQPMTSDASHYVDIASSP